MVLAKSCFYDNTIKGYVRACKPWQYLQGSPSQKSLLEVYNVAFLIWVFINCQSRVRIPGFSSYVCIVMVYITLFYFHTFADVIQSKIIHWCAKGSLNSAGDTKNPNKHRASACHQKQPIDTSVRRVPTPITETRNRTIKSSVEKSKGSERQGGKSRESLVRHSWGESRVCSTLASDVNERQASRGW